MIDATKQPETCKYSVDTKKTIQCYADAKQYLANNYQKICQAILHLIKTDKFYAQPNMIAGIALYLARGWGSTPIFPMKTGTVNRGYGLPKIPSNFPNILRKMAYQASKEQLDNFTNEMEWGEPEKRIQALKNQIKLFK